jgi:hypothetical protein
MYLRIEALSSEKKKQYVTFIERFENSIFRVPLNKQAPFFIGGRQLLLFIPLK